MKASACKIIFRKDIVRQISRKLPAMLRRLSFSGEMKLEFLSLQARKACGHQFSMRSRVLKAFFRSAIFGSLQCRSPFARKFEKARRVFPAKVQAFCAPF